MVRHYILILLTALMVSCCLSSPARAATEPDAETCRVRIENQLHGRIEMSVDQGRSYYLVGRVVKPASDVTREKTADSTGGVIRAFKEAFVIRAGLGSVIKIRSGPAPLNGKHRAVAMMPPLCDDSVLTDIPAGTSLFGELLPPKGSQAGREASSRGPGSPDASGTASSGNVVLPFPDDYLPAETDTLIILMRLPSPPTGALTPLQHATAWKEAVRGRVDAMARNYDRQTPARARANGRAIIHGAVSLEPKLPEHGDDIASIAFLLDGEIVSISNTAPFSYSWDTRQALEGEHVIEVRGLGRGGSVLTSMRRLVVVNNGS